jgi:hypothetical protein
MSVRGNLFEDAVIREIRPDLNFILFFLSYAFDLLFVLYFCKDFSVKVGSVVDDLLYSSLN